jgi:hypothetical protein
MCRCAAGDEAVPRTIVVQTARTAQLMGLFRERAAVFHKLFHNFCEDPATSRW